MKKLISVVVLVRNEELNLEELRRRLNATMDRHPDYDWEVLAMDNGSEDSSSVILSEFCRQDKRWKYVQLSRNFSAEGSMAAGLSLASGDAVCGLVSDLQDPPEILSDFIREWRAGADVVYGKINRRSDSSILRNMAARMAYLMIYHLSDCKIPSNAGSCHLLDRKVVDALIGFPEVDRYFRGLVHWVGFQQVGVAYDRAERTRGETKAGFLYCFGFAINAIISFSSKPLRFILLTGLLVTSLSLLLAVIYLVLWLSGGNAPAGFTTIILILLFSLGLQALFLGITGEYLAAVYRQVKGRPVWIARKTIGFAQDLKRINEGKIRGPHESRAISWRDGNAN